MFRYPRIPGMDRGDLERELIEEEKDRKSFAKIFVSICVAELIILILFF